MWNRECHGVGVGVNDKFDRPPKSNKSIVKPLLKKLCNFIEIM